MADLSELTVDRAGSPHPASVRVFVLGPLAVEGPRGPVHVAGAHRRRLLALLASRPGRVVSIDSIVDALWGDDPPPGAATTVRSHVSRLRRSLGDRESDLIENVPGGYRLAVDSQAIDAERFEQLVADALRRKQAGETTVAQEGLAAALDLWRGSAYLEFREAEFGASEGVRLDEMWMVVREELADSQIGSGAAAVAVVALERLVHDAPGRERAWQLLMHALYACGRQHDALSAYQRARRALAEFGLEPGAELQKTERLIVEQDPKLVPASGRSMLAAALRASSPLVGRVEERRAMATAWQAAKSGIGQLRILSGPLESGRTRLAADLAGRAIADGGAVDYARGDELLAALGGSPWSSPSRIDAGPLVDELANRCRVKPMVLIVDDAEWATGAAVDLLRALASSADQMALLVLLILDPTGGGPAVAALNHLDPTGALTIEVATMDEQQLAAIVVADGVDPTAVAGVVAMSRGLPGVARREAAAWAERTASERLRAAAVSSVGAATLAQRAQASVLDEVADLVAARARADELWSARWAGRQPYRALATYGPQDAELFVGRERLVAELAARVLERRFVVVVGASGSGKSSLARAGLVPLARSGRLPGSGAWATSVIVPGHDPVAALDMVDHLDEPGARLLIVDQFEETFSAPAASIAAFARALIDLAGDPGLDVHIVLVVRSDEFVRLAAIPEFEDALANAQLIVGPPTDDELRRIVVEPARRTGVVVEPELVDLVAHDVGGYEAALPFVSAALAEVWERRDGNVLRAQRYLEIGGVSSAVERLGNQALARAGDDHVDGLRMIMLALADVSDEGVWTRRRVAVDQLPDCPEALDALVEARLVVRADQTIEVTHEVVFRGWPQLVEWLEGARADLVLERDLRAAARAWDFEGRPDDNVYRGARLQAALEWADRHQHEGGAIGDFLTTGRELAESHEREMREQLRRERRARRRVTWALAAAALLLVLSIVAGSAALISRNNAQDATHTAVAERKRAAHQALVSSSVALRASRRDLAALLAVEAHRIAPSAATEDALFGLFTTFPGIGPTITLEGGFLPNNVGYLLPDGKTLVAADDHGVVRLVDVATGRDRARLGEDLPDIVGGSVFTATPDGRYLAAAHSYFSNRPYAHGRQLTAMTVWDLSNQSNVFETVEVPFLVGSLAITPDGSLLAVAGGELGRTLIYDGRTGALVRELPALPRPGDAQLHVNTVGLDLTKEGRLVVTSQAGPIRLFDLATGAETSEIDGDQELGEAYVELSADEQSMVTMGARGVMRYRFPSGENMWPKPSDVYCDGGVVYAPTLNVFLCGQTGGRLATLDLDTGSVVGRLFESQGGFNTQPVVTSDGSTVLALNGTSYTIWRTDGNTLVSHVFDGADDDGTVAYTDDGSGLWVLDDDAAPTGRSMQLIDPASGDVKERIAGYTDYWPVRGTNGLLVGFYDGSLGWYDLTARAVVGKRVTPSLRDAQIEPRDHGLIAYDDNGDVEVIDLVAGTVVTRRTLAPRAVIVRVLDDQRVLTVTDDGQTQLRDMDMTVLAETVHGDQHAAEMAVGSDRAVRSTWDGVTSLLDPTTMGELGTLPGSGRALLGLSMDAQQKRLLAVGLDLSMRLYDLQSRTQLGGDISLDGTDVPPAAIRPDGLQAAVATPSGIVVWDLDPQHWMSAACEVAGRNLTRDEWDLYIGDLAEYHQTCPQFPLPE